LIEPHKFGLVGLSIENLRTRYGDVQYKLHSTTSHEPSKYFFSVVSLISPFRVHLREGFGGTGTVNNARSAMTKGHIGISSTLKKNDP